MRKLIATPRRLLPTGLILGLLLAMSACETAPPVQEMSDARQAIEVAREAGAEAHAKAELYEAIMFLKNAETELSAHDYAQARRDALQAKAKAQAARERSESSQVMN